MNYNKYRKLTKTYDVEFVKNTNQNNFKKLISKKPKSLGRNKGKIVSFKRGGGVRRNYRLLNSYKFPEKFGILRSIEYDPNRSAFIGLIQFQTGDYSYILVGSNFSIGNVYNFTSNLILSNFKNGNIGKLLDIPLGVPIYNIENLTKKGAKYARAAGSRSFIIKKNLKYAKVKLPSGKEHLFDLNCKATIGNSSNQFHNRHKKYKAGSTRLLNKRPTVRGVAMNPIDHPHGGGEGKTSGGRLSVSP
jgi:large subunit ribosomal protein L2